MSVSEPDARIYRVHRCASCELTYRELGMKNEPVRFSTEAPYVDLFDGTTCPPCEAQVDTSVSYPGGQFTHTPPWGKLIKFEVIFLQIRKFSEERTR